MKRFEVSVPCASYIVYEVEAEDEAAARAMVEAGEVETANESEPSLNMDPDSWDVEEIGSEER